MNTHTLDREARTHVVAADGAIICTLSYDAGTLRVECDTEPVTIKQKTAGGQHGKYPVVLIQRQRGKLAKPAKDPFAKHNRRLAGSGYSLTLTKAGVSVYSEGGDYLFRRGTLAAALAEINRRMADDAEWYAEIDNR